jgi:hypothetical protein
MPKTYEPIATTTLGTATSAVTLSSIPGSYTDLILVSNPINSGITAINIYFNSDTGTNYSCTRLYGEGATAYSDRQATTSSSYGGWGTGTNTTNTPYIFVSQIMNYSNTTTNKSMITKISEMSAGYVGLISSLWRNTAAVTSLTFNGSNNFGVGSTFNLYGIQAGNA